jgi:hypothetical protein
VALDLGLRLDWFTVTGEIRWLPPASAAEPKGLTLSTTQLSALIFPCSHLEMKLTVVGCFVVELGRTWGSVTGPLVQPSDAKSAFTIGLGLRAGVEYRLTPRLYARALLDLLGAYRRARFKLDKDEVRTMPSIMPMLGVGLDALF